MAKQRYRAAQRLFNRAQNRHVEAGEMTDLSHLGPGEIALLIDRGAIHGSPPKLPLEELDPSITHDAAMRLWGARIQSIEDVLATAPPRLSAIGGLTLEDARELHSKALEASQPPKKKGVKDG